MHKKSNKTILVSSYAPPSLGGPQNLYNLLRDTDPSSYCILTSFYSIDNLSAQIGTWLKGEYIFYDNTTAKKNIGINKSDTINSTLKKRAFVNKAKHLLKRFAIIQKLIGFIIIITPIIAIVLKGKKTIKEKDVDSIIGFSDYGPAMIGAYLLHKITKKRYSIFLFDIYKGNFLPSPGNFLAKIFEPRMFKAASNIIVTNEGTRDFYIKRYGQEISNKIVVIHNSTFKEPYLKLEKIYKPKEPYNIVFTGRIYWPQIESLKNIIKAVSEIKDINIKLKIYSPSPKDYLESIGISESDKIEILVAPSEEMPEIQSKADILFLPLSWHTKSQQIIDTATPGKLTDYLIAGRPMLIHAPSSTFVVKYARENNFAAIVDEENIEKLKETIEKMITDVEYSKTLIKNAKETFLKNHDAIKNAVFFKELF